MHSMFHILLRAACMVPGRSEGIQALTTSITTDTAASSGFAVLQNQPLTDATLKDLQTQSDEDNTGDVRALPETRAYHIKLFDSRHPERELSFESCADLTVDAHFTTSLTRSKDVRPLNLVRCYASVSRYVVYHNCNHEQLRM